VPIPADRRRAPGRITHEPHTTVRVARWTHLADGLEVEVRRPVHAVEDPLGPPSPLRRTPPAAAPAARRRSAGPRRATATRTTASPASCRGGPARSVTVRPPPAAYHRHQSLSDSSRGIVKYGQAQPRNRTSRRRGSAIARVPECSPSAAMTRSNLLLVATFEADAARGATVVVEAGDAVAEAVPHPVAGVVVEDLGQSPRRISSSGGRTVTGAPGLGHGSPRGNSACTAPRAVDERQPALARPGRARPPPRHAVRAATIRPAPRTSTFWPPTRSSGARSTTVGSIPNRSSQCASVGPATLAPAMSTALGRGTSTPPDGGKTAGARRPPRRATRRPRSRRATLPACAARPAVARPKRLLSSSRVAATSSRTSSIARTWDRSPWRPPARSSSGVAAAPST
jgi:hypothetical protein